VPKASPRGRHDSRVPRPRTLPPIILPVRWEAMTTRPVAEPAMSAIEAITLAGLDGVSRSRRGVRLEPGACGAGIDRTEEGLGDRNEITERRRPTLSRVRISRSRSESKRAMNRGADPRFLHRAERMRAGRLNGALQIRIEHPTAGAETAVIVFGPTQDPAMAAAGAPASGATIAIHSGPSARVRRSSPCPRNGSRR